MMDKSIGTRTERDSMGEMQVPASALYGASTHRAVLNFPISGLRYRAVSSRRSVQVKLAAAQTNAELGLIDKQIAERSSSLRGGRRRQARRALLRRHLPDRLGHVDEHERERSDRASRSPVSPAKRPRRRKIHPNDHVNFGQSSNDVIPTATPPSAAPARSRKTSSRAAPVFKHH